MKISATTFQLKHKNKKPIKCTFDVGDEVIHPLGEAKIVSLNKKTGNCHIKLIEPKHVWLVFSKHYRDCGFIPMVFSTRKKARTYVNSNFYNAYIVKYLVDEWQYKRSKKTTSIFL